MNKNKRIKIIVSSIILAVACIVVGVVFLFASPNQKYNDYYVQYTVFYDYDIGIHVYYITEDEIYFEDERTFTRVDVDTPFYIYLRTGDIEKPYVKVSRTMITNVYHDEFGYSYISVRDINKVKLNPETIYGGKYSSRYGD